MRRSENAGPDSGNNFASDSTVVVVTRSDDASEFYEEASMRNDLNRDYGSPANQRNDVAAL
jgi:hypothetical protein